MSYAVRGYARENSKASETKLNTMDVMERKRARDTRDAADTLVGSIEVREGRSRVDASHMAFV